MTVRVPTALKSRIDKLAEATDRSSSWLAARALARYVEEQEWQLATIRQGDKDIREGRIVSHQAAKRWLQSWGAKRELPPPSSK